jgi:hypothetical protein
MIEDHPGEQVIQSADEKVKQTFVRCALGYPHFISMAAAAMRSELVCACVQYEFIWFRRPIACV